MFMGNNTDSLMILKALSDGTRFQIIEFLLEGRKCVCEIFPQVKKSQPTVSIHLGNLENWGIIKSHREGKRIFYEIVDLRVCDIFKALGNPKGKILKKECCGMQPGRKNTNMK